MKPRELPLQGEADTSVDWGSVMIDNASYYMRTPTLVAVTTARELMVIDDEGQPHNLATEAIAEWSTLLQDLIEPMSGRDVNSRLAGLPEADRRFAATLIATGMWAEARTPTALVELRDRALTDNRFLHLENRSPVCEHLVVSLTGSIMTGLMAPVVLSLAYSGFQNQLDVMLTESALKFTTRDLFESYGIRTWVGPSERRDGIHVPHVQLAESADCILVMPASANSLHRLAASTCSDLLSMTVTATRAPVIVMPVMNDAMWNNPGVQRNVAQLREDGVYVVEPGTIVGASALATGGAPMYGGPGTFWRGPLGVLQTITAVLDHRGSRRRSDVVGEPQLRV